MINRYISERALRLESYKAEPNAQGIALDKNEIPWGLNDNVEEALIKRLKALRLNRYPDNDYANLKKAISKYTSVDTRSICIGNGSDELIHMALQAFTDPGDIIAVQNPTFPMYKVYGTICGVRVWEYNLDGNFEMKSDEFINCIQREKPRIVFLCNPNNPTGIKLELQEIEEILKRIDGIVIVDEAYFEFSGLTAAGLLPGYENLIILRTFSKALGLAGLRVGYMLASPAVISCFERVRPPFNVNTFAQAAAVEVLEDMGKVTERVEIIKGERKRLTALLKGLRGLQCFESWSNFILFRSGSTGKIYERLQEAGIYVRNFSNPVLKDCLRVTIGSPSENDSFYEAVKEVLYDGA